MNRDSKNISSSVRPQIEMTKGHIRTSAGRWFDCDGYVGKTAIKELRASGVKIEHDRIRGSYRLSDPEPPPPSDHDLSDPANWKTDPSHGPHEVTHEICHGATFPFFRPIMCF